MNKNKDLARSGISEQQPGARNTATGVPETEHLAAFARRLGVNRSTVTRAAQAGRLAMTSDGRVLVAASLARWLATRGAREDVAARHAAHRGAAVAAATAGATAAADAPPAAQDGAGGDFEGSDGGQDVSGGLRAAAEAERLRWQNAQLQLSLELTRGSRIPRLALIREAQGLGNALRAAVDRLIDQTAPRLAAAAADPAEQRRILRVELAAVRAQQAGEFGRSIRRLRPQGVVTVAGAAPAESPEVAE